MNIMKELKDLTAREIQVLNLLGFQSYAKKVVIAFIEDALENNSVEDLHDKGIPQRSVKKLLKEIDPENNYLKQQKKKTQEIPKGEVIEMLNLKKIDENEVRREKKRKRKRKVS
jgi:hypothetical protein